MKIKFSLRQGPSTANAMALFTDALNELDAVVALESQTVQRLDAEIAEKVSAQTAAQDRITEADKFAKRIRKLVA